MTATPMAPASGLPMLRSPVYEARPRLASMPVVASAEARAVSAARASAAGSGSPAARRSSMTSVAGTSASRSVLSPTSDWPRCLMPSMAARRPATSSAPPMASAPFIAPPARRNAVPQSGPDVPPIRLVTITATFRRNVAASVRSRSSQSARTISKPRASE